MKYYYEYKYKNGSKVGGNNLEKIIFNDNLVILEGVDIINNFFQEVHKQWRVYLENKEIEYLKIEPMK